MKTPVNLFMSAWVLLPLLILLNDGLRAQVTPGLELKEFATGFTQPLGIVHSGEDRLYVLEKPGTIRSLDSNGNYNGFFLEIRDRVRSVSGEQGLLGLAFHPDFPANTSFFVNYTNNEGNTVISRFLLDEDNLEIANAESEYQLLEISQPYTNHNGGDLHFGPDGYLYIFIGDGGNGGDPGDRAQDPMSLLGKILRIDVDGEEPYEIPDDNPYAGTDFKLDEIWAMGLRNPWRNSFDRDRGDLWIGDVGQSKLEEINFQPAGSLGGENYGWRCYEGSEPFNLSGDCSGPFDYPVYEYSNQGAAECSVTGGYVYRGDQIPELYGKYIFGDFCSGRIWMLNYDSLAMMYTADLILEIPQWNLTAFGEDNHGELYLTQFGTGQVMKLTGTCTEFNYTLEVNPPSCSYTSDGEIVVTLNGGTPPYSSDLGEVEMGMVTLGDLECGQYSLQITDENNCKLNPEIELTCPEELFPDFYQSGDTLISEEEGVLYRWFLDDLVVQESTQSTLIIEESGVYRLEIINDAECVFSSGEKEIIFTRVLSLELHQRVKIFPNPASERVYIQFDGLDWEELKVYNSRGVEVARLNGAEGFQGVLNTSSWVSGWYLIEIRTALNAIIVKRILKEY